MNETIVPPAGTPAPAPIEQTHTAPSDWTTGFNPETKGWVDTKGFKDAGSLVDSYRNMEKLLGVPKERVLKLPEKEDSPEWGEIHNRLGRPSDPKDYDLKAIPDAKFTEFSRKAFHELGMSKKQGETLVSKMKEHFDGTAAESKATQEAVAAKEEGDLKREWGAAFDQNIQISSRAASAFGLDGDMIDKMETALGYKKTMSLLHSIGSKIGEGTYVGTEGASNSGVVTPGAAQAQIKALMADGDFAKRYTSGNAEAKAKMDHLHQMAAAGQ